MKAILLLGDLDFQAVGLFRVGRIGGIQFGAQRGDLLQQRRLLSAVAWVRSTAQVDFRLTEQIQQRTRLGFLSQGKGLLGVGRGGRAAGLLTLGRRAKVQVIKQIDGFGVGLGLGVGRGVGLKGLNNSDLILLW